MAVSIQNITSGWQYFIDTSLIFHNVILPPSSAGDNWRAQPKVDARAMSAGQVPYGVRCAAATGSDYL